jgi:sugar lactone lactonase YvrE
VEAVVLEASASELQVVAPAGAHSGPVTVAVGGQAATGPDFTYKTPSTAYYVSTVAGDGSKGLVNGSLGEAEFNGPEGIAVDREGNLIVVDLANHSIRKIDLSVSLVTTLAGGGKAGFADGAGSSALFSSPWKAAIGPAGNIFIADRDNFMVRRITLAGVVTTVAGDGTAGYRDGDALSAEFAQPLDVAVDAEGNVYVADNTGHRIRRISVDGQVSTLAGDGVKGYADGSGTAARFNYPSGITIDGDGDLIVADRMNNRIRKVTPEGVVTTLAGDGKAGYKDGDALSAEFSQPYGVAVGPKGNVFVADLNNGMIRMISTGGKVTTIAGSTKGYADGPGGDAQFNSPTDVAVDAAGNIYVADKGNQRIRKIALVK